MIDRVSQVIKTEGANGSAAGKAELRADSPGIVRAIHLDFTGQPETVDVTITDRVTGDTIYSKSNSGADVTVHPLVQAQDSSGANIEKTFVPIVAEVLAVSVAQGNSGATVRVDAYIEF